MSSSVWLSSQGTVRRPSVGGLNLQIQTAFFFILKRVLGASHLTEFILPTGVGYKVRIWDDELPFAAIFADVSDQIGERFELTGSTSKSWHKRAAIEIFRPTGGAFRFKVATEPAVRRVVLRSFAAAVSADGLPAGSSVVTGARSSSAARNCKTGVWQQFLNSDQNGKYAPGPGNHRA